LPHTLFVHIAPPQETPHPPQLKGALVVSTSHPSALYPSQSALPGAQTNWQLPLTHADDDVPPAPQWTPHPPQFDGSLDVLVSQPSEARPLQLAKPGEHDRTQRLLWQPDCDAIVFAVPQTTPHPPQLLGSEPVLVEHRLPGSATQVVCPPGQKSS
jgi:hypothetical protein